MTKQITQFLLLLSVSWLCSSVFSMDSKNPAINVYAELFVASQKGDAVGVRVALNSGADRNGHNTRYWGDTPLHAAAYAGYEGVVRLLLASGVDEFQINFSGQTAWDLARIRGHANIMSLLINPTNP